MTEALPFLSTLFSSVLDDNSRLTLFTLPDARAHHFATAEEAAEASERLSSQDVYFGVATRKTGIKKVGTEAELFKLPALWLDIDLPVGGHKKKLNFPPDEQSALAALNSELPPPSIIVHSGGGLHLYHLLDRPLDVSTPPGVAEAKRLLKAHDARARRALSRHGWEMDDTTKVPGILRVPGTVNYKKRT